MRDDLSYGRPRESSFILERRSRPPSPSPRRRRCRARPCRASDRARSSACSRVTMTRAPEAPIGWPSAQAPPLTLTLSCGEAEIAHRRHGDDGEGLVDLEQVDVVERPAGLRQQLPDRADRRGGEPGRRLRVGGVADDARPAASGPRARRRSGASAPARRAPSEIELELAAVTVPPSRNAGFSVGILSGIALPGCSSSATPVRPCRS